MKESEKKRFSTVVKSYKQKHNLILLYEKMDEQLNWKNVSYIINLVNSHKIHQKFKKGSQ